MLFRSSLEITVGGQGSAGGTHQGQTSTTTLYYTNQLSGRIEWSDFLRQYAVWDGNGDYVWKAYFPDNDNYLIRMSADDTAKMYIDNVLVHQTGNTAPALTTTMTVTADGAGGGAGGKDAGTPGANGLAGARVTGTFDMTLGVDTINIDLGEGGYWGYDGRGPGNNQVVYNSAIIPNSLLGAASLTASTPTSPGALSFTGWEDDGYWNVPLPWRFTYNQNEYGSVYVSTNSFLSFGGTSLGNYQYSWYPPYDKIMVSAGDNSCQRIYYGTEGVSPNRTFRVRWEGTDHYHNTYMGGSSSIIWEVVFYQGLPRFDVRVVKVNGSRNAVGTAWVSYLTDGSNFIGNWQDHGRTFPITSQVGYLLVSDVHSVELQEDGKLRLPNGTTLSDDTSGFFVDSLAAAETSNIVFYNTTTKELTYGTMADLRPDRIQNGSYYWDVDSVTGALNSDQGVYIADDSTNIIVGQNVDLTNSNQNRVAIGNYAGNSGQGYGTVAVGKGAGETNQNNWSTAVGLNAGQTNQNNSSVAVGHAAAQLYQGSDAVAVGTAAGQYSQSFGAVAVGRGAGHGNQYDNTYQGYAAIAIGFEAANYQQNNYGIAIGYQAAYSGQGNGAIAVGDRAAHYFASADSIAIGTYAAYNSNNGNGWAPIAIGRYAGEEYSGHQSIAIGSYAGNSGLGYHSVAIGHYAASNGSGQETVAVGDFAGQGNPGQRSVAIGAGGVGYGAGDYSVAIGYEAGWNDFTPLGLYQVAIGAYASAGYGYDNSIVLNASGSTLDATASVLFIKPVRNFTHDGTTDALMFYNDSTGEVRYSSVLDGGSF